MVDICLGESIVNRNALKRDVAHRCRRGTREDFVIVVVGRNGSKKPDAHLFAHAQPARLHHAHIGDNGIGDGGNVGDALAVGADAVPEATRRTGGIALRTEHGAREHERRPSRVGGIVCIRAKVGVAKNEIVGVDGILQTGFDRLHIIISTLCINGIELCARIANNAALMVLEGSIVKGAFGFKIGIACIHKLIGAFGILPMTLKQAIVDPMLLNRPDLTGNDLLVRTDRAQLLLVADEDVFGSVDFLDGLTHEVSSAQRIHRCAISNQHVARHLTIALLQDLGVLDLRGIPLGTRHRIRHRTIVSNIGRARIIALRRLLTLRSSTILRRDAAGLLIFRLRFCYRRLFQLARIRAAYLRLGMPPPVSNSALRGLGTAGSVEEAFDAIESFIR